jgi:hypothetical protein
LEGEAVAPIKSCAAINGCPFSSPQMIGSQNQGPNLEMVRVEISYLLSYNKLEIIFVKEEGLMSLSSFNLYKFVL